MIQRPIHKIALGLAMGIIAPLPSFGQSSTSGYSFLDIPMSSRAYALGGAATALVDRDILLSDQNPALLGPEIGTQAALSYTKYIASSVLGAAKIGMAASERSAWCAGIRFMNFGEFNGYLPDGSSTGNFKPADYVFEGSYSHDLNDYMRGGITYRTIYSNHADYSAWAMGVDLGVNYYNPDTDLSLSMVLTNMGGQIKRFDSRYTPLPFDIRFGYMKGLGTTPFRISINATNLTNWDLPYFDHNTLNGEDSKSPVSDFSSNLFRHLIFGLDYTPSDKFYLAAGYNYRTRTDMSSYSRNLMSGFSFGAGLNLDNFAFGIAYASPHKAASVLMLNLNWTISQPE